MAKQIIFGLIALLLLPFVLRVLDRADRSGSLCLLWLLEGLDSILRTVRPTSPERGRLNVSAQST